MGSQFKHGQYANVKIRLGRLQNLLSSACIEHLDLPEDTDIPEIKPVTQNKNLYAGYQSLTDIPKQQRIEEELRDFTSDFHNSPTHEIVDMIVSMNHVHGKLQLCGILLAREGCHFQIREKSVRQMIEELYKKAVGLRYWSALRYASSLLRKTVDSLTPYATAIIVNGKSLCVGTVGVAKETFNAPMTPKELNDAIFNMVYPYSVVGTVLQQEMILYSGKLIATDPELFVGILVLRMGWLIKALDLYKTFTTPECTDPLDNLPPSKVWSLLHHMLRDTSKSSEVEEPHITDLTDYQIKQLNGCLLRVPENFYSSVWQILSRCSGGIRFGKELLPQLPTIKLHEPFELSFYHLVENFFSQYEESCYRHLVIRVLTILAIVIKRNPEIQYKQQICIEELISESIILYAKNVSRDHKEQNLSGIEGFHRLSCRLVDSYIGRAIVNTLLGGEIGHDEADCKIQ